MTPIQLTMNGLATSENSGYKPPVLTVKKGNPIIVRNDDIVPQQQTSGIGPKDPSGGSLFVYTSDHEWPKWFYRYITVGCRGISLLLHDSSFFERKNIGVLIDF